MNEDSVIPLLSWVVPILSEMFGEGYPPILIHVHWYVFPNITIVGPVKEGCFGSAGLKKKYTRDRSYFSF